VAGLKITPRQHNNFRTEDYGRMADMADMAEKITSLSFPSLKIATLFLLFPLNYTSLTSGSFCELVFCKYESTKARSETIREKMRRRK